MGCRPVIRHLLALLFAVAAGICPARAQSEDAALEQSHVQVQELTRAGKYRDAEALALQLVEHFRKKSGEEGEKHGRALHTLADIYRLAGDAPKAEPLQRKACGIVERSIGTLHSIYAACINNLGVILETLGRTSEAESWHRKALALRETLLGTGNSDTANSLNNLGTALQRQGRLREAEPLHRRALAIRERLQHAELTQSQSNLATTLSALGQYGEAEALYEKAITGVEAAFGRSHQYTAIVLNNLAVFYRERGRSADSEPLLQRVEAIFGSVGEQHPDGAIAGINLAMSLVDQGKLEAAEALLRRALGILQRNLTPTSAVVTDTLINYAHVLRRLGRNDEAAKALDKAHSAFERSAAPDIAMKAQLQMEQALLALAQGRPQEALRLHQTALDFRRQLFADDHPLIVTTLGNMGLIHAQLGDWSGAARHLGMATRTASARSLTPAANRGGGQREEVLVGAMDWFAQYARALHRLNPDSRIYLEQAFVLAQQAERSKAGAALAQLSVRLGAGQDGLAQSIRQAQDLVHRRLALEQDLIQALAVIDDGPGARRVRAIRLEREAVDASLQALEARQRATYPDFVNLAEPAPLEVADVQGLIQPGEAVLLFVLPSPAPGLADEGLVFVITQTTAVWRRLAMGTRQIQEEVSVLRCGLDTTAWHRPLDAPQDSAAVRTEKAQQRSRAGHCRTQLRAEPAVTDEGFRALPFDTARAHALYKALFGDVESVIVGKSLLVVATGPLSQLPLHVLVKEGPASQDMKTTRWLVKEHAITVLPGIAALKGGHRSSGTGSPKLPMIGFGNPLLTGPEGTDMRALEVQGCGAPVAPAGRGPLADRGAVRAIASYFRGGIANVDAVRRNEPLPETASELCGVARLLGAGADAVHLGARATETNIKALSANGTLARARVLHFATHGLLGGEARALEVSGAEPALVLSPPAVASALDDGLLTASEIATLRIDADWVVMSACNTAGGAGGNAEPLSGLARAFFYAGARGLVVSHWNVDSATAETLVTTLFNALDASKSFGRAAALQYAMTSLIEQGGAGAHPAYWAPFVFVGGGAR